jgi:glycosyltransferase involved in cell wall biosynthesis
MGSLPTIAISRVGSKVLKSESDLASVDAVATSGFVEGGPLESEFVAIGAVVTGSVVIGFGVAVTGFASDGGTGFSEVPLAGNSELRAAKVEVGLGGFAVIGVDAAALGIPAVTIPWTEEGEVAAISSFDIGIMPLVDEPFERGKCGYKLIQYMACSVPVIASPVGVNCEIVEHGVNGFLAATPDDWERAITTLARDPQLRLRMGLAGRQRVEARYSLQVTGPQLVDMFRTTAHSHPAP